LKIAQEERSFRFQKIAFIKSCTIIIFALLGHWLLQRIWASSIRHLVQKLIAKYRPSNDSKTTPVQESPLSLSLANTNR
jgi:cytochrome oxidase assembly protein ShyY1